MSGAVSSTCQGRAPRSVSAARDAVDADVGGRAPQHPPQRSGVSEVLDRQAVLLGEGARAPRATWRAGRPRRARGRPRRVAAGAASAGSVSGGRSLSGSAQAAPDRPSSHGSRVAPGRPQLARLAASVGGGRRRSERRARRSTASGSIRPGEMSRRWASASRASHSSRTTAEPRRLADLVHARRCAATGRPGGAGPVKRASASNSCSAHSSLPCSLEVGRDARRAARRAPRRRAPRSAATARAAAGSTSRPPSAPWPGSARVVLDDRRRARPGRARRAGRRARCRTAGVGRMPTSARQGRSWVAACSTHSASPRASASGDEVGAGDRVDRARCRRPRGAAGRGRRAGRSGSPRPARRRRRPARARGDGPRPPATSRRSSTTTSGTPSAGLSRG